MMLLKEIWLCIRPGSTDNSLTLRKRLWRRIKLLHELFLYKLGRLALPKAMSGLKDPFDWKVCLYPHEHHEGEHSVPCKLSQHYISPTLRNILYRKDGEWMEDIE